MAVKHFYLVALAGVIGCASTGTSGGSKPSKTTLLTGDEIAAAHADITTAYDAVARLRPNWLAPHGGMSSNPEVSTFAAVFVDEQQYGDVNSLRTILAYNVVSIRYYDITQAGARFGFKAGTGGAIEVTTK